MDFAEEIPLLDLELPLSLDPADVPAFYEAFKEFDDQDTGFVLISVKRSLSNLHQVSSNDIQISTLTDATRKVYEPFFKKIPPA